MRMLRYVLAVLAFFLLPTLAQATTCFWVGGSGNYDNTNTASWASSSGGTSGTCGATGGIPKSASDIATFDSASGGGIVTICGASSANCPTSSGTLSLSIVNCGSFGGTLDFSVNNPTVNIGTTFDCHGSGVRTISLGSSTVNIADGGVFELATTTTDANLTFNAGTSNIVFASGATASNLFTASKTFATVTFGTSATSKLYQIDSGIGTTTPTIGTLVIAPGSSIVLSLGMTLNVTNPFNFSATSSSPIYFNSTSASNVQATIHPGAASTCVWCVFRLINGSTNTITATNSLNLSTNSLGTLSITPPSTGGSGGFIIGGG